MYKKLFVVLVLVLATVTFVRPERPTRDTVTYERPERPERPVIEYVRPERPERPARPTR